MSNESRIIELTSDELNNVTGGVSDETKTTIFNFLAGVPLVGAATQAVRGVANVVRTIDGKPAI